MIYCIFFKKHQGDLATFDSVKYLQKVICKCKNAFIIGWPGYISRSKTTLDKFYNDLNPCPGYQLHGFFFQPMSIVSLSPSETNESYLNKLFGGHSLPQPRLQDHSKILVILDLSDSNNFEEDIETRNFNVKGIMIGSSNQSTNTYFVSPSPKGEADVLFIDIDEGNGISDIQNVISYFGDNLINIEKISNTNNIEISKDILGRGTGYLKDIVSKLLENSDA